MAKKHIKLVVVEEEPSIRTLLEIIAKQICQDVGVDLDLHLFGKVEDAEPFVDLALQQTALEQSRLEPGKDRFGEVWIIDGKIGAGDAANELAARVKAKEKTLFRITGDPKSVPAAFAGRGVVYKPEMDKLVLSHVLTGAILAAIGWRAVY